RKVLDQLPCGRLVTRSAEYRQARTAGDRRARAIRSRQRSSHPGILLFRRQAAFEFTDVPGAGYVERKISPTEFVPHVGALGIGQWRRPATLEHPEVELKRAPEAAAFEITPAPILAQERLVLLQREHKQRFEFIERQQDRVTIGSRAPLNGGEHLIQLLPRFGRRAEPGLGQQVAPVKQQAHVAVPRYPV